MIVPETGETVWLNELKGLPSFDPGELDLIIVSPHPDDETLGAGALIASHSGLGRAVTIVAVTDGENAYGDFPGLAAIRIREQEEAVHYLSGGTARIVRLGLIDSGVSTQEYELSNALAEVVRPDTHLIAPWTGDFHPDHEACGRVAAQVAQTVGARLSWYFFWTWHRGTPASLEGLSLRSFAFDDAVRDRKWSALLRHKSQLERPSGDPILPANLLTPARRNFEVFAEA